LSRGLKNAAEACADVDGVTRGTKLAVADVDRSPGHSVGRESSVTCEVRTRMDFGEEAQPKVHRATAEVYGTRGCGSEGDGENEEDRRSKERGLY